MTRYSQGKQDSLIAAIFAFVGTTNGRAVEFGFGYTPPSAKWNGHYPEEKGRAEDLGLKLLELNTGLNTRLLYGPLWTV